MRFIIIMVLALLKGSSLVYSQNTIQIVNDNSDSIFQSRVFEEIISKISDNNLYGGVLIKKTNEFKFVKIENQEVLLKSEPFLNSNFEKFNYIFLSTQNSLFIKSEPEMFIHFIVKNKKVIFFSNFLTFNPCEDKIDSDLMFVEVIKLFHLTASLKNIFINL